MTTPTQAAPKGPAIKSTEKANGCRDGYLYLARVPNFDQRGFIGTAEKIRDIGDALLTVQHTDPALVAQVIGSHYAGVYSWHNLSAGLTFTFDRPMEKIAETIPKIVYGIKPNARRNTMLLEDHLCHCKLGQGGQPLTAPCNCSPYCTARETQRRKLLDQIRAEFPNHKNDKVFGGNAKVIKIVLQTPPNGFMYSLLYYISGTSASDSAGWPNLCIEPLFSCYIPVADGLPADSGLDQFQRVCEVVPGLSYNVPFELTQSIINLVHSAKTHVRSARPLPEDWVRPTIGDMLLGHILLRDLVEVLFFSTSHVVNGLYVAFQGNAPGAECENVFDYKFRVALCGTENSEKIYYHILS